MVKEIYLQGISVEEFYSAIEALIEKKVKAALEELKQQPTKSKEKYLIKKEVIAMLKVSLPTLHSWTKQGIIRCSKVGSRVFYKESEIEKMMDTLTPRRKTF